MEIRGAFLVFLLILFACNSFAAIDISIIQTSDLHSHFTSRDSDFGLGGLARVKTKIDELRLSHPDSLVMDAGDFSEGNIFFALDSGETTFRLLSAMNYDAIVLGNHDWLIGADVLAKSLSQASPLLPILSANLNMKGLAPQHALRQLIKPYIVKEVAGVRVGILGLSTFQFVYDGYFRPVKVRNPVVPARYYVDYLRNQLGCNMIVVLSHLGLSQDKLVAKTVGGIDLIVGGHNHNLFKKPVYVGKVPIVHIGKWGEYVGLTTLTFDRGNISVSEFKTFQIDESVSEDPLIKSLVDGSVVRAESLLNTRYGGREVSIPVDLAMSKSGESVFSNQVVDAVRKVAQTSVAFDSPSLTTRGLHRGLNQPVDFYNALPHIAQPISANLSWKVFSFDVSGVVLKLLIGALTKFGAGLSFSNAHVVVTTQTPINPIVSIDLAGQPLESFKSYRIGGSEGVLAVFEFLKAKGIPIEVSNIMDSGVEVWKAVNDYFWENKDRLSTMLTWEGRMRTKESDIMVRPEDITLGSNGPLTTIKFAVRNNGLTGSSQTQVSIGWIPNRLDILPNLERPDWQGYSNVKTFDVPPLEGGKLVYFTDDLQTQGLPQGKYPVRIIVTPSFGEADITNNVLATAIDVP